MSAIITDKTVHQKLVTLIVFVLISNTTFLIFGFSRFRSTGLRPTFLLIYECWVILVEIVHGMSQYSFFLADLYYDKTLSSDKEEFFYYFGKFYHFTF